jgi:hypothetical protein
LNTHKKTGAGWLARQPHLARTGGAYASGSA